MDDVRRKMYDVRSKSMANEIVQEQNIQKGEIILYQPDETVRIEVRMGGETVWLTQQQMAELFDKDRTVIGRHIRNIYKEEELERDITCAKFAHMGLDGDQQYEYTAYNLDVIISVGYRVKSKRGTKFRQWANKILKEYLLRGYAVNNRINALERQVAEQGSQLQVVKEKIDFFVRTSLPPVEGIFYDGQIFDAYRFVSDLIRKARRRIVLIDNYVDDTVLTMLDKRTDGVCATIYTQHISQQFQQDIDRHNAQYPPIIVEHFNRAHDRFLLIVPHRSLVEGLGQEVVRLHPDARPNGGGTDLPNRRQHHGLSTARSARR